jgi:hypothetical protein
VRKEADVSDETSEVTALIRALRDGSLPLDEVARRFRERNWPATKPSPPASYIEMAERASDDPRPDVPNSFDDVVGAYDRGELTYEQYRVLAEAVAEAKRARQPGA